MEGHEARKEKKGNHLATKGGTYCYADHLSGFMFRHYGRLQGCSERVKKGGRKDRVERNLIQRGEKRQNPAFVEDIKRQKSKAAGKRRGEGECFDLEEKKGARLKVLSKVIRKGTGRRIRTNTGVS